MSKMNMDQWTADVLAAPAKKALPVLSFPSIQLMNCTVRDLISDSDMQARGMKLVADRTNAAASVSLMDLSVEAECFGAPIHVSDDEVPTCVGPVISTEVDEDERLAQAEALAVPEIGTGRTGLYIEAIEKALKLIEDRPVLAGVIGPFSLAGRLVSVTEAMLYCYDEPDMMHTVLEKTTEFITKYILAYKAVGAAVPRSGTGVLRRLLQAHCGRREGRGLCCGVSQLRQHRQRDAGFHFQLRRKRLPLRQRCQNGRNHGKGSLQHHLHGQRQPRRAVPRRHA